MNKRVKIKSAKHIAEYKIHFAFTNGISRTIDFFSFLSSPLVNPMSSKYLNKRLFKKFSIINKMDISWNDYEMCFPIWNLYTNKNIH